MSTSYKKQIQNKHLKSSILLISTLLVFSVLGNISQNNKNKALEERNAHSKKQLSSLQAQNADLQKQVSNLKEKNTVLQDYADDASSFLSDIRPWLSENDSSCEEKNCKKCAEIEQDNQKAMETYNRAIKDLSIDPTILYKLKQGPKTRE